MHLFWCLAICGNRSCQELLTKESGNDCTCDKQRQNKGKTRVQRFRSKLTDSAMILRLRLKSFKISVIIICLSLCTSSLTCKFKHINSYIMYTSRKSCNKRFFFSISDPLTYPEEITLPLSRSSRHTDEEEDVKCVPIRDCPTILNALSGPITAEKVRHLQNLTCGFEGSDPKVMQFLTHQIKPKPTVLIACR